jgi:hypothetical protein
MARRSVQTGVALAAVAAAAGGYSAMAADTRDPRARTVQKPIRFFGAHLFIEVSTDGDALLRLDADGDAWRHLRVRDPRGRTVIDFASKGHLRRYGLTGFDADAGDLPFRRVPFGRLKARFPEGRYSFVARTLDGRRLIGSDRLTHDIARRPVVLAPSRNAVVDAAAVVVSWRPVTKPSGIRIVRYRVVVSKDGTNRELGMDLTPQVTSVTIPAAFLEPGAKYDVEVVARESSGNETVTEVPFRTAP